MSNQTVVEAENAKINGFDEQPNGPAVEPPLVSLIKG